jgi:hypothetical protein
MRNFIKYAADASWGIRRSLSYGQEGRRVKIIKTDTIAMIGNYLNTSVSTLMSALASSRARRNAAMLRIL